MRDGDYVNLERGSHSSEGKKKWFYVAITFMFLFCAALAGGGYAGYKWINLKNKKSSDAAGSDASSSAASSSAPPAPSSAPPAPSSAPPGGPESQVWIDLYKEMMSNLNTSVDPCEDFYQYACGGWIASHPLGPSDTRLSRSFDTIAKVNEAVLQEIAIEDWPVVGPMYKSCMDTSSIEAAGVAPVKAIIDKAFETMDDFFSFMGEVRPYGIMLLFGRGPVVDSDRPTRMLWDISQGGLNLPDTSYYADGDVMAQYTEHITNMMAMWYDGDAAKGAAAAKAAVAFESAVAKFTADAADMRDPYKLYNKVNLDQLVALSPTIDWDLILSSAGFSNLTGFLANVDSPAFVTAMGALLNSTSIEDLGHYALWTAVHSFSDILPSKFRDETFKFYGVVLSGITEDAPRWQKCVASLDSLFGDIIGRYFVAIKFAGDSRNLTNAMIKEIKGAFGDNLPTVDWMDNATRSAALDKLNLVGDLIGYPDKWDTYPGVTVNENTFAENYLSASSYSFVEQRDRLNRPSDRTVWEMTADTVNAYYEPTYNTINFPAGIIQPPYFSKDYPDAVNYGGIGMVMGHELTHGFDDQGRLYDGTGKLTNWWTNSSTAQFETRAQCLVQQYEKFTVAGIRVNGSLTLGENIADNGGIQLSYRAFKKHQSIYGEQSPINPSLSNDKLFFLGFGQGWCMNVRQELAKRLLRIDPHSPPFARVNGPLTNFPTFGQTFGCKAGQKMYPKATYPEDPNGTCVLW